MNPLLDGLHPYPFERLRRLHEGLLPDEGTKPINLGVGEPQHATPQVIKATLTENLHLLGKYPPTGGTPEVRESIARWLTRRYGIPTLQSDREVLPVAGSREALFAFAQTVLDPADAGVVLLPNPFYQIYEGAAIMAGAKPFYVSTPASRGFLPDWESVPAAIWPQVSLVYVCSPGNPAGAVFDLADWLEIFDLADHYGFIIAADECYSEIYSSAAPIGALEAAHRLGRGIENVVVFNSLSKRSSAPGLRSGFVAGDAKLLERFLLYRTYHGAAPSLLTQVVSTAAWDDEAHVRENRRKYQAKFEAVSRILPDAPIPAGGFFLWLSCRDDEALSRRLYQEAGLTVLPGRYLGRDVDGGNPGAGYIRVALVPEPEVCERALLTLRPYLDDHGVTTGDEG